VQTSDVKADRGWVGDWRELVEVLRNLQKSVVDISHRVRRDQSADV
jgi:hypothetical protein